jgi:hypothetical protein
MGDEVYIAKWHPPQGNTPITVRTSMGWVLDTEIEVIGSTSGDWPCCAWAWPAATYDQLILMGVNRQSGEEVSRTPFGGTNQTDGGMATTLDGACDYIVASIRGYIDGFPAPEATGWLRSTVG